MISKQLNPAACKQQNAERKKSISALETGERLKGEGGGSRENAEKQRGEKQQRKQLTL